MVSLTRFLTLDPPGVTASPLVDDQTRGRREDRHLARVDEAHLTREPLELGGLGLGDPHAQLDRPGGVERGPPRPTSPAGH